jgi:hypothetical protein
MVLERDRLICPGCSTGCNMTIEAEVEICTKTLTTSLSR